MSASIDGRRYTPVKKRTSLDKPVRNPVRCPGVARFAKGALAESVLGAGTHVVHFARLYRWLSIYVPASVRFAESPWDLRGRGPMTGPIGEEIVPCRTSFRGYGRSGRERAGGVPKPRFCGQSFWGQSCTVYKPELHKKSRPVREGDFRLGRPLRNPFGGPSCAYRSAAITSS
jgi:hypothetical protein